MGGVFNTVNMHTYHYAGNNPIKLTDPDGRDIESLNNENNGYFLRLIIQIGGEGFYFDENNKLKIDETIEPSGNYSQTAREQLIAGINNTDKTVYLKATENTNLLGSNSLGFVSWVEGNKNAMIAFIISPELNKPSKNFLFSWYNATEDNYHAIGLLHELLGHALPSLGITNTKDSRVLERLIRSELGWSQDLGSNRGGIKGTEPSMIDSREKYNLNKAKNMK
jgi:hypothetical protein